MIRRRVILSAATAVPAALALPACAQPHHAVHGEWPRQGLRLIVGYPAGTSPDLVGRAIAEPLAERLGQPVMVENRAGAGGSIGADLVAKATDGHTLGITTNGPLTTAQQFRRTRLPYDPRGDLLPLSLTATSPLVLVVGHRVPASTLAEFIALARARPGAIAYGSAGAGSGSHLTMELFSRRAGIDTLHVPFQGFPQVTSAILGGQIQAGFMAPSGALVQARAGRVRLLGITSPQRSPNAPELPTIAEAARMPGFSAELWTAAIAPAGLPPRIAQRLSAEIGAILQIPEVQHRLADQRWHPMGTTPQDLSRRMAADTRLWNEAMVRAKQREG